VGGVITGVANFTAAIAAFADAVDKFIPLLVRNPDPDMRLRHDILGTWRYSIKLPISIGDAVVVVPIEYRTTLLKDGTLIHRGSYIFQDQSHPIAVSGKWSIRDGLLYYTVESSNVEFIKPRVSTVARISIKNDVLTSKDKKNRSSTKVFSCQ
jgi:hypothetical protein